MDATPDLDGTTWHRNNRKAASMYCADTYADVRLSAFQADGSRWLREEIVKRIRDRL